MSHRTIFIILLIIGCIVITLFPNGESKPIEELPYWKNVHQVDLFQNVSGPHWIYVSFFTGDIETNAPSWENVAYVEVYWQNSTITPETYWVIVSKVNLDIDTVSHWQIVSKFSNDLDTITYWENVNSVSFNIDTETQFVNCSSVSNEVRSNEITTPQTKPVKATWINFVTYMIMLWLVGMVLGVFAPYYGQIVSVVLMGIVIYMTRPDFLMVLFVIIIGAVAMLLYGKGDGD